MQDLALVPVPNPEFCAREVDDETVILSPAGDEIHSLDEVATFIWRRIDGEHTLADILEAIVATYDVEPERARDDLQRLMAELVAGGMVTLTGG